jgi:hypothetical protein
MARVSSAASLQFQFNGVDLAEWLKRAIVFEFMPSFPLESKTLYGHSTS